MRLTFCYDLERPTKHAWCSRSNSLARRGVGCGWQKELRQPLLLRRRSLPLQWPSTSAGVAACCSSGGGCRRRGGCCGARAPSSYAGVTARCDGGGGGAAAVRRGAAAGGGGALQTLLLRLRRRRRRPARWLRRAADSEWGSALAPPSPPRPAPAPVAVALRLRRRRRLAARCSGGGGACGAPPEVSTTVCEGGACRTPSGGKAVCHSLGHHLGHEH